MTRLITNNIKEWIRWQFGDISKVLTSFDRGILKTKGRKSVRKVQRRTWVKITGEGP
jgi:hypothetical protein